ncbi:MAG: Xaa-Pro peptidase family protein [Candidatus Saccharimonadales bacterium]
MRSLFTPDFFLGNRQALRKTLSAETTVVLFGNGLVERGGDSTYAFHQDSNFWYLTGCDEPDLVLVMDGKRDYLLVPSRDAAREAFDGSIVTSDLQERSGITDIRDMHTGWQELVTTVKNNKQVSTVLLPEAYNIAHGTYANPAQRRMMERLKRAVAGLKLKDVTPQLKQARVIKQEPELRAIKQAIDITTSTLAYIRQKPVLSAFAHEYQLEAAISLGFRSQGSRGNAFEPIVANGQNACVLHNVANSGQIDKNKLTVIDVGADVEHYAADITRTLIVNKPSSRQQVVHQAVLEAQAYAFKQLKPGVLLGEYERDVAKFIGEKLRELKLITTVDNASVRKYFPHATSHFLGLDVHDVGEYHQPLQPGMVLTVEPGIYIPEEGIGVRIEDDVLITKTGIEVLSDTCSRDLG